KGLIASYKKAGMKLVLDLGLHYPPQWIFNYANSRYVDQNGTAFLAPTNSVNLTFSENMRKKAEAYLAQVNKDLNLNNFWAIRLGGAGSAEVDFPPENYSGTNEFWAFDANAQDTSSSALDRPSTIPANPLPGWKPGQTTLSGQSLTTNQIKQWFDWYEGALVDTVNWQ